MAFIVVFSGLHAWFSLAAGQFQRWALPLFVTYEAF